MLEKIINIFLILYIVGLLILSAKECKGADFDTTTIEVLEVYRTYEFGFPVKDTVLSNVHWKSGNKWWVHTLYGVDLISDKQPLVILRSKD